MQGDEIHAILATGYKVMPYLIGWAQTYNQSRSG